MLAWAAKSGSTPIFDVDQIGPTSQWGLALAQMYGPAWKEQYKQAKASAGHPYYSAKLKAAGQVSAPITTPKGDVIPPQVQAAYDKMGITPESPFGKLLLGLHKIGNAGLTTQQLSHFLQKQHGMNPVTVHNTISAIDDLVKAGVVNFDSSSGIYKFGAQAQQPVGAPVVAPPPEAPGAPVPGAPGAPEVPPEAPPAPAPGVLPATSANAGAVPPAAAPAAAPAAVAAPAAPVAAAAPEPEVGAAPEVPPEEPEEPAPEPGLTAVPAAADAAAAATTPGAAAPAPKKKGKSKTPVGMIAFHKVNGELKQVLLKTTDEPSAYKGGWKYIMTVAQAQAQGLGHGDIVPFTIDDPLDPKAKPVLGDLSKVQKAAPQAPPEEQPPEELPPAEQPPEELPKTAVAPEAPPAPVAEPLDDKTKKLIKYLKSINYDDPKYTKGIENSDALTKHLKATFGADWKEQWQKHSGVPVVAEPEQPENEEPAPEAEEPKKVPTDLKSPKKPDAQVLSDLESEGFDPGELPSDLAVAMFSSGGIYTEKQIGKFLEKIGWGDDLASDAIQALFKVGLIEKHKKNDGTEGYAYSGVTPDGTETPATPKAPAKKGLPLPGLSGGIPASDLITSAPKLQPDVPSDLMWHFDDHDIDPSSPMGVLARVMFGATGKHFTKDALEQALKQSGGGNLSAALNAMNKLGLLTTSTDEKGQPVYSLKIQSKAKAATAPAPALELPPAPVPKKAKKAVPEVPLAKKKFVFPDNPDKLKLIGNAKSLGGFGEKYEYEDPKDGSRWLFKVAKEKDSSGNAKPFAAHIQEAFSTVAAKVKPGHLPIRVWEQDGKHGTLQPLLKGSENLDEVEPATLSSSEAEDVAAEHVLDWLMSQHDSYGGNLIKSATGKIIGVDKEQAFKFWDTDKLSTSFNPNPKAPYYNQFWESWKNNEFKFNPKSLHKYIKKIESISDDDYREQILPYAKSFWDGMPKKQQEFLEAALKRKKNIRSDFEDFLTGLYQEKTKQPDGVFTFAEGWDPNPDPKKMKIKKAHTSYDTLTAQQYADNIGVDKILPSYKNPMTGSIDTEKVGIRVSHGQGHKLIQFAQEMGLKPYKAPDAGSNGVILGKTGYYDWMFFDKKDWNKATVQKPKAKVVTAGTFNILPTPSKPEYQPKLFPHEKAKINTHEIVEVGEVPLGVHGKRFTSDGGLVEHQAMKVQRAIDTSGKPFYMFHCKLRRSAWQKFKGQGQDSKWFFNHGSYDDVQDGIVHQSGATAKPAITEKWSNGKSEVHICTDDDLWAYMGGMYAKIYPKEGQTPLEAFHETVSKIDPKFADALLKPPTKEEHEIQKLARMLWSVAPQQHDTLKEKDFTIPKLKALLASSGWDETRLAKLEEQEVFPGYSAWVEPGRWKKMGVAFVTEAPWDINGLVGCLKTNLAGVHERSLIGVGGQGGQSTGKDLETGSGDGILCEVTPKKVLSKLTSLDAINHWTHMNALLLYAPDVTDRHDSYLLQGDCYGACRPTGASHSSDWVHRKTIEAEVTQLASVDSYNNPKYSKHEINFRKGLSSEKLIRVLVENEPLRQQVIVAAKKAGVHQINHVPIEDFVVVAESGTDIYTKYVQPLGY